MKKIILASAVSIIVVGCAATPNPHNIRATSLNDQCNPIERDLSTTWENRDYWCAPNYYKEQAVNLQKQIAYENKMRLRAEEQQRRELEKEQRRQNALIEKQMKQGSKTVDEIVVINSYSNPTVAYAPKPQNPTTTPQFVATQSLNYEVKVVDNELKAIEKPTLKNTVDYTKLSKKGDLSSNDKFTINFFGQNMHEQFKVKEFIETNPSLNSVTLIGCQLSYEAPSASKERLSSVSDTFKTYSFKGKIALSEQKCTGQTVLIQK